MTAARAARLARLGWIAARGWALVWVTLAVILATKPDAALNDVTGPLMMALAPWALAWVWQGRLALRRP